MFTVVDIVLIEAQPVTGLGRTDDSSFSIIAVCCSVSRNIPLEKRII